MLWSCSPDTPQINPRKTIEAERRTPLDKGLWRKKYVSAMVKGRMRARATCEIIDDEIKTKKKFKTKMRGGSYLIEAGVDEFQAEGIQGQAQHVDAYKG